MFADEDYSSFYDWIRKNGGEIHKHVKIDVKEQRGLFATDTIESHSALSIIPRLIIVNNQHSDLSAIQTDTQRQGLIIFLLYEYARHEKSSWSPWIKLLNIDKEADELLKAKTHMFNCVEHSTLGQALTARYQQLQEEYEQLSELNIIDVNFELFCFIDHLVWSRVLDLPENEPLSLVPFIDFANHSLNGNARWFIDDETHNLILRAERQLNPGEEITISYGLKSNEELLYLYGFAVPNNPDDRVTLPVSLSPDDPLVQDKLCLIQQLKLPPRLTLNIDGHLNEESNRLVKILSAQTQLNIDKDHEHYKLYLLNLCNEYFEKLNLCSDDEIFIKYYLDSQKLIIQKAMENLK